MNQARKVEQTYTNKSASFSSDSVEKADFRRVSAQVNLENSSGFTGSSSIEVSNDLDNWSTVTNSSVALTDSNFYDVETAAAYVRVTITITAGSGDINIDWVKL